MPSRLSNRLTRIEFNSDSSEQTVEASRLLVSLLGRFHALWWPWRTHEGSYRAEVRRMQLEYLAGTSGLRAAGSGEQNWKSAHFARNELIARGQCKALVSGGQVTALRLTPRGIADAGALIGDRIQTLHGSLLSKLLLVTLRKYEGNEQHGPWMLENELFGHQVVKGTNPSAWEHVVEHVLPLLSSGLVECTSDLWNRVYYRAIDGVELPVESSSELAEQEWADDAYIRAFDSERASLQRMECVDGGIYIPLRCT